MGVISRIGALATVATVVSALAAPSAALAWEWPFFGSSDDLEMATAANDDTPVTFATGWYLRGDFAANKDQQLNLGGALQPAKAGYPNSWSLEIGAGYKFSDYLRSDFTVDYNNSRKFSGSTSPVTQCQTDAYKEPAGVDASGAQLYTIHKVYDLVGCLNQVDARMSSTTLLWNIYADLGTWYGLTPYIGAGVGGSLLYQKMSQTWIRMSNGSPYHPNWVDPLSSSQISVNWDQARSTSTMQFAWAAMFGASYAFTRHTSIDVGYRLLHLGNYTNYASFAGVSSQPLVSHQVRVGFRYTPD